MKLIVPIFLLYSPLIWSSVTSEKIKDQSELEKLREVIISPYILYQHDDKNSETNFGFGIQSILKIHDHWQPNLSAAYFTNKDLQLFIGTNYLIDEKEPENSFYFVGQLGRTFYGPDSVEPTSNVQYRMGIGKGFEITKDIQVSIELLITNEIDVSF